MSYSSGYNISFKIAASAGVSGPIFSKGTAVFLSWASPMTNGGFTTVRPTATGNIVRVVGHSISSEIVFFNPSSDFIEI